MFKIPVFPMNKKAEREQSQQEKTQHPQDPFDDDRGKDVVRTDAGLRGGNPPDDIVPDGGGENRGQKARKVVGPYQREKRRIQAFCLQQDLPLVCHEDPIGIDDQEGDRQVMDLDLSENRPGIVEVQVTDKQKRDENGKGNLEQEDPVFHGVIGCS